MKIKVFFFFNLFIIITKTTTFCKGSKKSEFTYRDWMQELQ